MSEEWWGMKFFIPHHSSLITLNLYFTSDPKNRALSV